MFRHSLIALTLAFSSLVPMATGFAPAEWSRPFPPFQIVGNLYYVGTYDLSSYLLVTPAGNIVINTGLADSVPQIQANIATLGFKLADTKILLATHPHWDHAAGLAELKKLTGARMLATAPDANVFESGGKTDFRFGNDKDAWYAPVKVDEQLQDGQKITLGGTTLTVRLHPGHTKGAASYEMEIPDGTRTYRVLIANLGSINPGVTLRKNANYPGIAADYAHTFAAQKAMNPEVFLASHASQFDLHRKHQPGAKYDPTRFIDPQGFQAEVRRLEKIYLAQMESER